MFLAGRVPESHHAYAASRRLVRDDPVRVGGLLLKSAKVAQRLGQYPVALRRITTGLRALAHDDSPDGLAARARLMRSVATCSATERGDTRPGTPRNPPPGLRASLTSGRMNRPLGGEYPHAVSSSSRRDSTNPARPGA